MAKKVTWHDRVIAYMTANNYLQVSYQGEKYTRFKLASVLNEGQRTYLVGRNGNVRRELKYTDSFGKEKTQTVSVTEMFQKYVERWENEQK